MLCHPQSNSGIHYLAICYYFLTFFRWGYDDSRTLTKGIFPPEHAKWPMRPVLIFAFTATASYSPFPRIGCLVHCRVTPFSISFFGTPGWSDAHEHNTHSRPQSPRSFWPVAGIESSGQTRFSEHAQSISFALSTNQICQIWREVRELRTSGVGQSQSSRFLPQARRIVGSGDENAQHTAQSAGVMHTNHEAAASTK